MMRLEPLRIFVHIADRLSYGRHLRDTKALPFGALFGDERLQSLKHVCDFLCFICHARVIGFVR